jgi:hypothetical protein
MERLRHGSAQPLPYRNDASHHVRNHVGGFQQRLALEMSVALSGLDLRASERARLPPESRTVFEPSPVESLGKDEGKDKVTERMPGTLHARTARSTVSAATSLALANVSCSR